MLDEIWLLQHCSMKYLKDYIFTLAGGQDPQILGTESEEFDYFNNSQSDRNSESNKVIFLNIGLCDFEMIKILCHQ
jgi:hypothetical protein